jgi:hypothetical protein
VGSRSSVAPRGTDLAVTQRAMPPAAGPASSSGLRSVFETVAEDETIVLTLVGRKPRPGANAPLQPEALSLQSTDTLPAPSAAFHVPRFRDIPTIDASRFRLLQLFECVVLAIDSEDIQVSARDLTARSLPSESFVVSADEFEESDLREIVPGTVFYWSIGYRTLPTGTRERVSSFRLRRLPPISHRQRARIAARKQELLDLFGESAILDGSEANSR